MRIIHEFDIDNPNDNLEERMARSGRNAHLALWDMDQWLRDKVKHFADDGSEEVLAALTEQRDHLHDLLDRWNIDLDNLQ